MNFKFIWNFRNKPLENFEKWRTAALYSELAYQNETLIDQFIELLDKKDYEVRKTLSEWNYKKFKLLEPALKQIRGTKIRYIHHSEFDTDVYIFENSKEVGFLAKKFETKSLD